MSNVIIKKEFRSVNSKPLVKELENYVDTVLEETGMQWDIESQREAMTELVEDAFESLVDDGKIETYKVMCDRRNNSSAAMDMGQYKLDAHFRQHNCVNITKLIYSIQIPVANGQGDAVVALDFTI